MRTFSIRLLVVAFAIFSAHHAVTAAEPGRGKALSAKRMLKMAEKYMPDRERIPDDGVNELLNDLYSAGIAHVNTFKGLFDIYLEQAIADDRQIADRIVSIFYEYGFDALQDHPFTVETDDIDRIVEKRQYFSRAGIIRQMLMFHSGEDFHPCD